MFLDYDSYKYCIKPGATDMRYGEFKLVEMIQEEIKLNPFDRIIFLFASRDAKRIKAIVWDGNGFWMMSKRLQTGTFAWPRNLKEALMVSKNDVERMLRGENVFRRIPTCKNGLIF